MCGYHPRNSQLTYSTIPALLHKQYYFLPTMKHADGIIGLHENWY
jgi:hypothetical protein